MIYVVKGKDRIPLNIDAHITHESNGNKTLEFTISQHHEHYSELKNETLIECDDLFYNLKLNDCSSDDEAKIECTLNKDDFLLRAYDVFKIETQTLDHCLHYVLDPLGWKVVNTFVRDYKRTIELENVVDLEILQSIADTFSVVYAFDNKNKILSCLDPDSVEDKGFFISTQSNVLSFEYTADTYEFFTKIIGYGKKDENEVPLTIASINEGEISLENHTFSNKIITSIFSDERFTDPESLKQEMFARLDKASSPEESYQFKIINLAKMRPKEYYLLNFGLHDVVWFYDRNRKQKVKNRIIQYDEYQNQPEKDEITISDKPLSIVDMNKSLSDKVGSLSSTISSQKDTILKKALEDAQNLINEFATKGHRYDTENETYYLDTLPKESAKYVLRINLGGIAFSMNGFNGPYSSAWTIDGKFNADFITAGKIRGIEIEGVYITGSQFISNNEINGEGYAALLIEKGFLKTYDFSDDDHRNTGMITSIAMHKDGYRGISLVSQKECCLFLGYALDDAYLVSDSVFLLGDDDFIKRESIPTKTYGFFNKAIGFGMNYGIRFGNEKTAIYKNDNNLWIGASDGVALTSNSSSTSELRVKNGTTDVWGTLQVNGSLKTTGSKNRIVRTENHGYVAMNAVESPSCYFEDVGSAQINDEGFCIICHDIIFRETINLDCKYYVQVTACGEGHCFVDRKKKEYFVIKGTPGLIFDWTIKAKQKGYENDRMDISTLSKNNSSIDMIANLEKESIIQGIKKLEANANNFYLEYIKKFYTKEE